MDWRVIKSSVDFLLLAYKLTTAASGRTYATIGLQPLIFGHLQNLCKNTIAGTTSTGFTTPKVKQAARALLNKLTKYEGSLTSRLAQVALFLDPRQSSSETPSHIVDYVRSVLISEYGLINTSTEKNQNQSNLFDLFGLNMSTESDSSQDEVDDFIVLTTKPDRSCQCPVS